MPPGDLGVGGVAPLDLGKTGNRIAEVGKIERAGGVVVREVPDGLAFGRRLDDRECGVRELADVGPGPDGSRGVGRGYGHNGKKEGTQSHAHPASSPVVTPHRTGPTIDGPAPLW